MFLNVFEFAKIAKVNVAHDSTFRNALGRTVIWPHCAAQLLQEITAAPSFSLCPQLASAQLVQPDGTDAPTPSPRLKISYYSNSFMATFWSSKIAKL